ncbi:MAG: hypothetical protein N3A38_16550, partial [Planctomycetota bacterium]|nr:hypothetical protein [Planctomycetota bacterium]
MNADWKVLPLVFRVRLQAAGRFPKFKGTVLRGAFGVQFRKTVCATRLPDCAGCSLAGTCAFPWVFDTPGAGSADPRLASCRTHAPHPFAIRAPEDARVEVPAGTEWRFGFAIVGRARELLPYFIHAFLLLEEAGLGLDRAPVRVLDAVAELPDGPWTVYSEGAPALRYPPSAVGWPGPAHGTPSGSGDGGPGRAHDAGTGAEYGGVEKRGGAEAGKSGRLSVRFDSPVRIRAGGALSRDLP